MTELVKPAPLIWDAIERSSIDELKTLFERFPEMRDWRVPAFGNWLGLAVAVGTPAIIKHLIEQGFDINSQDPKNGGYPLDTACRNGNAGHVQLLLNAGAVVPNATEKLTNPLFACVIGKSLECTQMILDAGIDTSQRFTPGAETNPALDAVAFAMMWGQREIAHLIALHNFGGDEAKAQAAMAEGLRDAQD